MRVSAFLCCIVLLLAGFGRAQEYPAFEINFSASHLLSDFGGPERESAWGVQSGFATNLHRHARLTTSFGTQNHGAIRTVAGQPLRLREYQVMAGPEFIFSRSRVQPFARALFGVAARHFTSPAAENRLPLGTVGVDWGFAMAWGGGLDLGLARVIAIRVLQVDYVPTKLSRERTDVTPVEGQITTPSGWQHNLRVGFGVTLRLGTRGR